jgi:hypothetical protein
MPATLILVGIVIVVIATIVLVAVPVKHVEAVAREFYWRRIVHIGRRVWVKRKSKRQPKPSVDIRNVAAQNADDPSKLHYTYEERVWRNMRTAPATGRRQTPLRDPLYTLGRDEEVRGTTDSYEARFVSAEGRRYRAKVRLAQWNQLKGGAKYRLGKNALGHVRTVKPPRPAVNQRRRERMRRAS